MIGIIDYGAGNIRSIHNMLKRLGFDSFISGKKEELESADKLILPGVGHFDHGMKQLHSRNLTAMLHQRVMEEKVPILGICLGAQLLGQGSEEGNEAGLGWVDMKVVAFDKKKLGQELKIPHMGWNYIQQLKSSKILGDEKEERRFYFVHSYHMLPLDPSLGLCSTKYGYEFISAISKDNIIGVQFHPEKSHQFGMKIMKNFAQL